MARTKAREQAKQAQIGKVSRLQEKTRRMDELDLEIIGDIMKQHYTWPAMKSLERKLKHREEDLEQARQELEQVRRRARDMENFMNDQVTLLERENTELQIEVDSLRRRNLRLYNNLRVLEDMDVSESTEEEIWEEAQDEQRRLSDF